MDTKQFPLTEDPGTGTIEVLDYDLAATLLKLNGESRQVSAVDVISPHTYRIAHAPAKKPKAVTLRGCHCR
jgi:hypothetical protein